MKTVILVRHGKASHDDAFLEDIKRPLTNEGRKRTKRIARYLTDKNIAVEKIITSQAVRAFETAKILACELEINPGDFIIEDSIYEAMPDHIFNVLFALPDEINRVMIVGHNPGLYLFATQFMQSPFDSLPTSGVVSLKFEKDSWIDTGSCRAETDFIVFPSMLM
jgi:phosphohistidine phosphatase